MEKLEVEGSFSVSAGWSARTVLTTESEEVKGAENEKQGMEVDEMIPRTQPSSKETDGGFMMCELEEREAARVEVQGPIRRNARLRK